MQNILQTIKIKLGDLLHNFIPIHLKVEIQWANSLKNNLLKLRQEEIENMKSALLKKLNLYNLQARWLHQ